MIITIDPVKNPIKTITPYDMRILVRLPNWVGDAVMATPVLRCLRLNFPRALIDVACLAYVREVIEGAPWVDNIIELPSRHKSIWLEQFRYAYRLREKKYDLALVLPNSFRSALFAFAAGAQRRIGYDREGRAFLLTDAVPAQEENGKFIPQPMVDYYLNLCETMGIIIGSKKTELFVDAESECRADELFQEYGLTGRRPVVAIAPGAAFGSSKLWNPQSFAKVADSLMEQEACQVVLVGGPNERPIAREIESAAQKKPANLVEKQMNLSLLKSIAKRCDLFITVDSGPRHFAVAFGKPVVVLMGATDPRYTNCNLEKTIIVAAEGIDCAPCQRKLCPTDHRCMTRISPAMVLDASIKLLTKYVQ